MSLLPVCRVTRIGTLTYGAMLSGSAIAKLLGFGEAAAQLSWIGLTPRVLCGVLLLVCLAESAIGGALIGGLYQRHSARLGMALAIVLFTVHLNLDIFGPGDATCGCWGSLAVPAPVTYCGLIVGGISCYATCVREKCVVTPAWLRAVGVVIWFAAAFAATGPFCSLMGFADSMSEVVRTLAADKQAPIVGVVVDNDCPHCVQLLAEMDRSIHAGTLSAGNVVLFVKEDDLLDARGGYAWENIVAVPSDTWWDLVQGSVPCLVWIDVKGGIKGQSVRTVYDVVERVANLAR